MAFRGTAAFWGLLSIVVARTRSLVTLLVHRHMVGDMRPELSALPAASPCLAIVCVIAAIGRGSRASCARMHAGTVLSCRRESSHGDHRTRGWRERRAHRATLHNTGKAVPRPAGRVHAKPALSGNLGPHRGTGRWAPCTAAAPMREWDRNRTVIWSRLLRLTPPPSTDQSAAFWPSGFKALVSTSAQYPA